MSSAKHERNGGFFHTGNHFCNSKSGLHITAYSVQYYQQAFYIRDVVLEKMAALRALCDEMAPVVQLIDPRLDTRPGRTMSNSHPA